MLFAVAAFLPETALAALFGDLFAGSPPATLGVRDGMLAPCPDKPNCVSSRATDDEHAVAPFAYTGDPTVALGRLAGAISMQPGARIVTRKPDYVHAEFQSRMIGFVDDLEVQVDAAAQVIHVRSASRLGRRDFGVNRARIEALRAAFAGTT
jgi:uncharacterized protein (DUF1499 family)